jgi:hypothetical protein
VTVGDDVGDAVGVSVTVGVGVWVATTGSVAVADAVAVAEAVDVGVAVPVTVADGGGVSLGAGVGVTDGVKVGRGVSVANWPGVEGKVDVAAPGVRLTRGTDEGVNVDSIPSMVASAVTVTMGSGSVGIAPGARV